MSVFRRKNLEAAYSSLLALALTMAAVPIRAEAQAPAAVRSQPAQPKYQPMTTGSPTEKMDAGEPDATMEGYRHSSTVRALSGLLHISVERAAQLFEDFNSGVLILAIAFFLFKYLPAAFRGRREKIGRELADARSATELANQRLKAVEARLAALDTDIEHIREQAARDSEVDQKRIEASLEAERQRIVHSAEQEIGAAQSAAQRELKRFAADLAVERAMDRIHLSADEDKVLVHEFTEGLAGSIDTGNFSKRGQN